MLFPELNCLSDRFKIWIFILHTEIVAGVCVFPVVPACFGDTEAVWLDT